MDENILTETETSTSRQIISKIFSETNSKSLDSIIQTLFNYSQQRQKLIIDSVTMNISYNQRLRSDYIISSLRSLSPNEIDTEASPELIINQYYTNIANNPGTSNNADLNSQIELYIRVNRNFSYLMSQVYAKYNVLPIINLIRGLSDTDQSNLYSFIDGYNSNLSKQGIEAMYSPAVLPKNLYEILEKAGLLQLTSKASTAADLSSILNQILIILVAVIRNNNQNPAIPDDQLVTNIGYIMNLERVSLRM